MSNQIQGQLLDSSILSTFPILSTQKENGLFPTVVYSHRLETPADGGDPVMKICCARMVQRMDGSKFLIRKTFSVKPGEEENFPEGSVYPKDLFILETNSDQIAGGELLKDVQNNVFITSGGKELRRLIVCNGDQIAIKSKQEIVPGIEIEALSYQTISINGDIRMPHDRRERAKSKTPTAAEILAQGNV